MILRWQIRWLRANSPVLTACLGLGGKWGKAVIVYALNTPKDWMLQTFRVYSYVPFKSPFFLLHKNMLNEFIWCSSQMTLNTLKQDCIPVGCVPPACCPYLPACTVLGGVWSGGCLPLVGRGCIPACNGADPPPANRITDTCKNITLPQLRCGR